MNQPSDLMNNPKFTVRYNLGLFMLSNWVYNTLVTGSEESLADFSGLSEDVFNDKMFFMGAYKQMEKLVADISDETIVSEMLDAKTFLLSKKPLLQVKNLSEEGMKAMSEAGESVYSMLFAKRLAENIMFEEDLMPTTYTCVDGSDKNTSNTTVPLQMVFSIDSNTLDGISRLFDFSDTTAVSDTIANFLTDPKLECFKSSFSFMQLIESQP